MFASFLTQAFALHLGDLSQVQPILTTELLFLVLLLATWFRFRIGLREWLGCLAAAGGLAGFLAFAQPGGGDLVPTNLGWLVAGTICVGVILLAVVLAMRGPRWWRAAMFGAAGAVGFAFTASLIKTVGNYRRHRLDPACSSTGRPTAWRLRRRLGLPGPERIPRRTHRRLPDRAGAGRPVGQHRHRHRAVRRQPAHRRCLRPLEALSLLIMFVGAVSIAHSPLISGMKGDDERYSELLSLRSRSQRLVEAVQDQVPPEVLKQLPTK